MPSSEQPTSIRLPREYLTLLRKEASARQWGVSKVIRDIIRQWVDWQRKQKK